MEPFKGGEGEGQRSDAFGVNSCDHSHWRRSLGVYKGYPSASAMSGCSTHVLAIYQAHKELFHTYLFRIMLLLLLASCVCACCLLLFGEPSLCLGTSILLPLRHLLIFGGELSLLLLVLSSFLSSERSTRSLLFLRKTERKF